MLAHTRRKSSTIQWVQGDALALPFADGSTRQSCQLPHFSIRDLVVKERLRELGAGIPPGKKVAVLKITRPRGLCPFFRL